MFDIGWSEMLLLGIVGLLVVGPRELPRLLRTLGQYAGQLRQVAQLFKQNIADMADEVDAPALKDFTTDFADEPDLFKAKDKDKQPAPPNNNEEKG